MNRQPRWLRDLGVVIALAAFVLSARASLADHYVVPSGSMKPTVHIGDRVLVDKRAFGLRVPLTSRYVTEFAEPRHGDVVVLTSPVDGKVLLKRIAGLPGELVEVRDGWIYIDGNPAEPTYQVRTGNGGGRDFGPRVIPRRKYLVLGDNRGDSFDGRYFGLVARDALLGRAEGIYLRDGGLTWFDL